MSIFSNRGIKLFTDLDIDFNIVGFAPKEKLCLLIGSTDDDIVWNYSVNEKFEKLDIIAVVNEIPVFAPLGGKIEKVYSSEFKGQKSVFCTIIIDEVQPPSYPILEHEEEPTDIFTFKKLLVDAAIQDDFKKQPFIETLYSTKKYKKVILNCCDDQPYVLSKTATLMNYTDEVLGGLELIKSCLNIKYKEAVIFKNFIVNKILKGNLKDIRVTKSKMKYPVSSYFSKREHRESALIVTPEMCRAVYRASFFKEPTVTKIITAWGDALNNPKIIELPFGTLVNDILNFCDANKTIGKIISSGVIAGYLTAPYLPITQFDDSVTALIENVEFKQQECINCGRCLEVCPAGLAPCYILQKPYKIGESKFFKTFNYCIECGCCSYVCPANIPLKSYIKSYKAQSKKVQDEQN